MKISIDEVFGKALRELRDKKNLSQEGMAELCDMDRTYISLLERGKRSPTLRTIVIICKSLDISLVDLMRLVETFRNQTK